MILFSPVFPSQGIDQVRLQSLWTDSNYAQVTALHFLDAQIALGHSVTVNDMIFVTYSGGQGIFSASFDANGYCTLSPSVLLNNAPQVLSTSNSLAAPGTIRALTGAMNSTATVMTSGNLVGVRGSVNAVGMSGGFLYGAQGKVIATGTLSGGWTAGVFGQVDMSAATITTGEVSPVWSDFGTTATGTHAGARLFAGTNTTAAILGSNLYMYGAATNLFKLDDNNGLSGPTYFVNAGTSSGSAGDATHCAANKVWTVMQNGVTYYVPLFASNS